MDISSQMADLLLKGWVMTNNACDTCAIPLMRTPRYQEPRKEICVNCNNADQASTSHASDTFSPQELSTPATDLSSELSQPAFVDLDTEQITRRRAQSDTASAEIGRRLLQGWTMLADECPRSTCYGIPLVRPPKSSNRPLSDSQVGLLLNPKKFLVTRIGVRRMWVNLWFRYWDHSQITTSPGDIWHGWAGVGRQKAHAKDRIDKSSKRK